MDLLQLYIEWLLSLQHDNNAFTFVNGWHKWDTSVVALKTREAIIAGYYLMFILTLEVPKPWWKVLNYTPAMYLTWWYMYPLAHLKTLLPTELF